MCDSRRWWTGGNAEGDVWLTECEAAGSWPAFVTHISGGERGMGGGGWGNCRERAAKSMKGAVREFTSIESWDCFRWLRITKLFCSFSRPSERGWSWMHKLGNVWCSSPDPGGVGHTWSHVVVEPIMQQARLCCLRAPQQKVQPGQGSQCKPG